MQEKLHKNAPEKGAMQQELVAKRQEQGQALT